MNQVKKIETLGIIFAAWSVIYIEGEASCRHQMGRVVLTHIGIHEWDGWLFLRLP